MPIVQKREFIGKGFLNTTSKIFVRILSRIEDEVIDEEFFLNIIKKIESIKIRFRL